MEKITILDDKFLDANEYTLARCQALPKGYLYKINQDLNIFQLLKSFSVEYQDIYKEITKAINGFYIIDETSIWLDELLSTYGLPNIIFPVLSNAKDKALAINMMRYLKTLNSVESYQEFLLLLGFDVKFYLVNEILKPYIGFNYSFPICFSNSTSGKDKITYFVSVNISEMVVETVQNIGSAFQIQFTMANNTLLEVKKILDFIQPDFIIFQYITNAERQLYNIL